jgi:hypothetical protein
MGPCGAPVGPRSVVIDAPVWVRAPLPWRVSLGSFVVATATDERVLDGAAAAVWESLDAPRTETELVTLASEAFGLEADTARSTLAALADAGLCRPK